MGRIPEETIERIASANDIVEVIGSYFPLKRAGATYKALCPFHREKTPSFTVNGQRQIFHCFGCGAGGSVFRFVMQYESVDFPTAAKRLADRAGIRIVEEEYSPAEQRKVDLRRRLLALHHEVAKWFHRNLIDRPDAKPARDYLRRRGLNSTIAADWQLGYAPEAWDALIGWAQSEGFNDEELRQSGLVSQREGQSGMYDRFRGRVMFPICNDYGEVIAFSGRTLEESPRAAKYVNSPETLLFTKGRVLFGLHKTKRALVEAKNAIVCEGQLDLITAYENGVQNVIAPQGTAFTPKQARILKQFVDEVVLCFDSDAAGMKAAERSLPALLDVNLFVRVAEMPEGHDPDSLIRAEGAGAFRERTDGARDFFDYQIDRYAGAPEFQTPRGKLQLARRVAAWAALVSEPVIRDTLVNTVTARLGVSERDFRGLIPSRRAVRDAADADDASVPPGEPLSQTMRMLCLLALRVPEARARLSAVDLERLAGTHAGFGLLAEIVKVGPDPEGSPVAFAGRLSAEDESVFSSLLLERVPENAAAILDDCLAGLERDGLRRRQEEIASRLRSPGLSGEDIAELQKEVLDLQKCLTDIARPFSR